MPYAHGRRKTKKQTLAHTHKQIQTHKYINADTKRQKKQSDEHNRALADKGEGIRHFIFLWTTGHLPTKERELGILFSRETRQWWYALVHAITSTVLRTVMRTAMHTLLHIQACVHPCAHSCTHSHAHSHAHTATRTVLRAQSCAQPCAQSCEPPHHNECRRVRRDAHRRVRCYARTGEAVVGLHRPMQVRITLRMLPADGVSWQHASAGNMRLLATCVCWQHASAGNMRQLCVEVS